MASGGDSMARYWHLADENAPNHVHKRTSHFIFKGSMNFLAQKMGKLQHHRLEFTHFLMAAQREARAGGKKSGNRPPFFGRIPTCKKQTRQGGCRGVNDATIASKAKAQLAGFMGKAFTHFPKPARRFVEECIYGIQASGDTKLSSIVRASNGC